MSIEVVFVCLGNICRSPSAEAVMVSLVEQAGLSDKIHCDSAGTSGHHDGETADPRSIAHGKKRNYDLTSISRKFLGKKDFERFDYIVVMDDQNLKDVLQQDVDKSYRGKVFRMVDFSSSKKHNKVPDPYYTGADGFEVVLDILEDACRGLLSQIRKEHGL